MKTADDIQTGLIALLLESPKRRKMLQKDLAAWGVRLLVASRCREVTNVLRTYPDIQLVLRDVTLADGN